MPTALPPPTAPPRQPSKSTILPPAAPPTRLSYLPASDENSLRNLQPLRPLEHQNQSTRKFSSSIRNGNLEIVEQKTMALVDSFQLLWARTEVVPGHEKEGRSFLSIATEEGHGWLFICRERDKSQIFDALSMQGCIRTDFDEVIKVEKTLAQGSASVILKGTFKDREAGASAGLAIKRLRRDADGKAVKREVDMLIRVQGHPCIIGFRGIFISPREDQVTGQVWSLVVDFHSMGDLFDYTKARGGLDIFKAASILRDVLSALCHLARLNIFHRDVKPENVLVRADGPALLCDFGIAVLLNDKAAMANNVYTRGYASPEMVEGTASSASNDVFGAGCTFHFMLTRQLPFFDPNPEKMAKLRKSCRLTFSHPVLTTLTQASRDLLQGMLNREPFRLTAVQALQHPGLVCTVEGKDPGSNYKCDLGNLSDFNPRPELRPTSAASMTCIPSRQASAATGVSVSSKSSGVKVVEAVRCRRPESASSTAGRQSIAAVAGRPSSASSGALVASPLRPVSASSSVGRQSVASPTGRPTSAASAGSVVVRPDSVVQKTVRKVQARRSESATLIGSSRAQETRRSDFEKRGASGSALGHATGTASQGSVAGPKRSEIQDRYQQEDSQQSSGGRRESASRPGRSGASAAVALSKAAASKDDPPKGRRSQSAGAEVRKADTTAKPVGMIRNFLRKTLAVFREDRERLSP
eukprot:TRINITY_DN51050_c0_g1_i1.p1 TRINITY_DN51050_c0_g1~~TRINITY_DN51050_c0_g1_i1.p1  ORF type:complete len:698 (+),score=138.91 TRINITY_DN51050_c0_g1_i1:46-2139(+)